MNRRLALWTVLVDDDRCVPRSRSRSRARRSDDRLPGACPTRRAARAETGIQVSDGVLMHVGAGAEAGYDTNVFYEDAAIARARRSSARRCSRTLSNATRAGPTGRLSFNVRAGLTYRRYQSDDPDGAAISATPGCPPRGWRSATGSGQLGFGIADTFVRTRGSALQRRLRSPITRYNNQASAEVRWSPGGGRLTGTLRYTNMIDFLQGDYSYATSMTNSAHARRARGSGCPRRPSS